MNYEKARLKYMKQFISGKWKDRDVSTLEFKFPFGKRYCKENFLTVKVPLSLIKVWIQREDLVQRYSRVLKTQKCIEPIWVSIGRKLRNGKININWDKRFKLLDGNHRSAAAKSLGMEHIDAIMPESHYEACKLMGIVND